MLKIFIVGLAKSGTTSVAKALEKMGFSISTNPFGPRFLELFKGNYSLDDSDVYWDVPIPAFTKEFVETYPDAKFIYNYREPSKWYASVEKQAAKRKEQSFVFTEWLERKHIKFPKCPAPVLALQFAFRFGHIQELLDKYSAIDFCKQQLDFVREVVPNGNLLELFIDETVDNCDQLAKFVGYEGNELTIKPFNVGN